MSKRHENIIINFELEQGNYYCVLSGKGLGSKKSAPTQNDMSVKNGDGADLLIVINVQIGDDAKNVKLTAKCPHLTVPNQTVHTKETIIIPQK